MEGGRKYSKIVPEIKEVPEGSDYISLYVPTPVVIKTI